MIKVIGPGTRGSDAVTCEWNHACGRRSYQRKESGENIANDMTKARPKRPFCDLARERIWLESALVLAFPDGFLITEGHALVIPRRHFAHLLELPKEELGELSVLVANVRRLHELVTGRTAALFAPATVKQPGAQGFGVGLDEHAARSKSRSYLRS